MKTKSIFYSAIAFLLLLITSASLSAQVAEVGVVRNGKAEVTSLTQAAIVLKAGLSTSATIDNIHIELETKSGKYYLIGYVSNDRVTGKAIELKPGTGGVLLAAAGPGLEVTCTGFNCGRCIPKINNWSVRCLCEDSNPPSDMRCDMQTKVVVSAW